MKNYFFTIIRIGIPAWSVRQGTYQLVYYSIIDTFDVDICNVRVDLIDWSVIR